MNKIGQMIKDLRKEEKITIKEMADKVGMSANEIANIEKGKRRPRATTISKIALAMNWNYEELSKFL